MIRASLPTLFRARSFQAHGWKAPEEARGAHFLGQREDDVIFVCFLAFASIRDMFFSTVGYLEDGFAVGFSRWNPALHGGKSTDTFSQRQSLGVFSHSKGKFRSKCPSRY